MMVLDIQLLIPETLIILHMNIGLYRTINLGYLDRSFSGYPGGGVLITDKRVFLWERRHKEKE